MAALQPLAFLDVLTYAQVMDGSNCSFTGPLPDAAFRGAWLRRINLSTNKLRGSISNTLTSFELQVNFHRS